MNTGASFPTDQPEAPLAEEVRPRTEQARSALNYGPAAAVFVTIAAYFVSQLLVAYSLAVLPSFTGWDKQQISRLWEDSPFMQFLVIFASEATLLLLLWLFMESRRVSLKSIGLVKPKLRDTGYAIIGFVVYFVLLLLAMSLVRAYFPNIDTNQQQDITFSRGTSGAALWLVFASLVLIPPVVEEITFRGFLYTGLRGKLPGIIAAVITSLLFAAAHLQFGSGKPLLWGAGLDTFVLSMVLVHLREKTGRLWSPMLVHMMKNGLAFSALFLLKI